MKRVAALLLLVSCLPEAERRASHIEAPRVIAIVSEPAESRPGEVVRHEVVVASPEGPVADPDVSWWLCRYPKTAGENGAVSAACLAGDEVPLGTETALVLPTPEDACAVFGPEQPPDGTRPRDPDLTGGYYLPFDARLGAAPSYALHRVRCDLADAPLDVARAFEERYRDNQNPALEAVRLWQDGAPIEPSDVRAAGEVTIETVWAEASTERYPVYDRERVALIEQTEALSVSWYATAGVWLHDRTGGGDDGSARSAANRWTAPAEPQVATLWIVLRDDRGGVAHRALTVQIGP